MLWFTINSKNYLEEKLKHQKKEENLEEQYLFKKKFNFTKNFLNSKKAVWMSHEDAVVKLPKKFENCIHPRLSKLTIIENSKKNLWNTISS